MQPLLRKLQLMNNLSLRREKDKEIQISSLYIILNTSYYLAPSNATTAGGLQASWYRKTQILVQQNPNSGTGKPKFWYRKTQILIQQNPNFLSTINH